MDPPLIREIEIKIERCQQKNIYVYKCREREHARVREREERGEKLIIFGRFIFRSIHDSVFDVVSKSFYCSLCKYVSFFLSFFCI